jgi:hypothetical protein
MMSDQNCDVPAGSTISLGNRISLRPELLNLMLKAQLALQGLQSFSLNNSRAIFRLVVHKHNRKVGILRVCCKFCVMLEMSPKRLK